MAGLKYISSKFHGFEYSEEQFEEKTGAVCSFCRTPVGGIEEVACFITPASFICKDCMVEPEMTQLSPSIAV